MIRRAVDLLVSALVLVVTSPILIAVAIAVKLESPGPVFYRGDRVGKDFELFSMWKFRTMVADADRIGPEITGGTDPRITRVGAFLRATKIDELPQFINVITGEMTLVGPRPEHPDIVDEFYTDTHKLTLAVKPGVTGPGSVYYSEEQAHIIPDGTDATEFYVEHLLDEKLAMELEHMRNRTVAKDIRVVVDTIAYVVRSLLGRRTSGSS